MNTRRDFLAGAAATAAVLPLAACAADQKPDYATAAEQARRPAAVPAHFAALVRYATLAPNGHNTQPWRFAALPTGASILPDLRRRTPIVDPDDHHLWVSLGCAAENFLIAAGAHGRPGAMRYDDAGDGRIDIDLATAAPRPDRLYDAITLRQCTRSVYDGRPVANEQLNLLAAAARTDGVTLSFITNLPRREAILDFLIAGNDAQMDDPQFVHELRDWIRFNSDQALAARDSLFSRCSGNPAIPTWVGKRFFGMLFTKNAEREKYIAQMRSSAGVAVFVGDVADQEHWVRVGRSFQRFALQATALGMRHAMINQPVEVPAVRSEFARWLGRPDQRPDLVVRFGYAPPMPMSLRRPPRAVIVPGQALAANSIRPAPSWSMT